MMGKASHFGNVSKSKIQNKNTFRNKSSISRFANQFDGIQWQRYYPPKCINSNIMFCLWFARPFPFTICMIESTFSNFLDRSFDWFLTLVHWIFWFFFIFSETVLISNHLPHDILHRPEQRLKLTLFMEEAQMYLCFNKRWRLVSSVSNESFSSDLIQSFKEICLFNVPTKWRNSQP